MFVRPENGKAFQCQGHDVEVCDMKLVDPDFVLADRDRNGWRRAYHLDPWSTFSRERRGKQTKCNGKNKGSTRQTKTILNLFFHDNQSAPLKTFLIS